MGGWRGVRWWEELEGRGKEGGFHHSTFYTSMKSSNNKENYREKVKGFNVVARTLEKAQELYLSGGSLEGGDGNSATGKSYLLLWDCEAGLAAPPTAMASGSSDFEVILSYKSYWFPFIGRDLWEGLTRSIIGAKLVKQDLTGICLSYWEWNRSSWNLPFIHSWTRESSSTTHQCLELLLTESCPSNLDLFRHIPWMDLEMAFWEIITKLLKSRLHIKFTIFMEGDASSLTPTNTHLFVSTNCMLLSWGLRVGLTGKTLAIEAWEPKVSDTVVVVMIIWVMVIVMVMVLMLLMEVIVMMRGIIMVVLIVMVVVIVMMVMVHNDGEVGVIVIWYCWCCWG